jgi:signal transduction histidine kinase
MCLVFPLIYQGEIIIGWLGVGPPRRGRVYAAEKLCFLEVLAGQATLAIQSIHLNTELETLVSQLRRAYHHSIQAQENERRQLAEALHDETLQHLADISVRLGLLRSRTEISPADLEDVQARLARADRYLREMVRGVHPAILSDLGLIEAVIAFLETLAPNSCPAPVRVELWVSGFNEQRLPDQHLELALYRFMQNGALNALNHSHPGCVRVEFIWGPDSVEVQVKDDGCGMTTTIEEATRAGHFGLLTMRERIEALGGNFVASSTPGRGTQMIGRVPVTSPSPAPGQIDRYTFDLTSKT